MRFREYTPHPGLQILLETFLGLEVVGYDHERSSGEQPLKQCGKERLRGRSDAGAGKRAAPLQSPCEGLHGGSSDDPVEQTAGRRDLGILRQAKERLPPIEGESSRRPPHMPLSNAPGRGAG